MWLGIIQIGEVLKRKTVVPRRVRNFSFRLPLDSGLQNPLLPNFPASCGCSADCTLVRPRNHEPNSQHKSLSIPNLKQIYLFYLLDNICTYIMHIHTHILQGNSQSKDWNWVSYITGRFFTICITKEAYIYMAPDFFYSGELWHTLHFYIFCHNVACFS